MPSPGALHNCPGDAPFPGERAWTAGSRGGGGRGWRAAPRVRPRDPQRHKRLQAGAGTGRAGCKTLANRAPHPDLDSVRSSPTTCCPAVLPPWRTHLQLPGLRAPVVPDAALSSDPHPISQDLAFASRSHTDPVPPFRDSGLGQTTLPRKVVSRPPAVPPLRRGKDCHPLLLST